MRAVNFDRIGTLACFATMACGVVLGVVAMLNPDLHLQPSDVPVPLAEFVEPTNTAPDLVLAYLGVDLLYVVSYLVLFVALAATTVRYAPVPTWIAAISIGVAAALDVTENAFFITYALQAQQGIPLVDPPLVALHLIGHTKTYGLLLALSFLALALPVGGPLTRTLRAVTAILTVTGAVGLVVPDVQPVRVLPQLALLICLIVFFRRRSRQPDTGELEQ